MILIDRKFNMIKIERKKTCYLNFCDHLINLDEPEKKTYTNITYVTQCGLIIE